MPQRPPLLRLRDDDAPPLGLGLVASAAAIAATTALIYLLDDVAPVVSLGVVYLVGVLVVSSVWGWALGIATAVASALAFNFFHIPPTGHLAIRQGENWVALIVFLIAAALASALADQARSRARDARQRREEADLAAAMAETLLGSTSLADALPLASARLAAALRLPMAQLRLGDVEPRPRYAAIALDLGPGRSATLVVPDVLDGAAMDRLRTRVAPSLGALLAAALDRDRLQGEVVETAALRRSDVIKTALLRAVSHDLRTPLTSIIAAADAVRSPTMDAAEREELGALIVEEAARLSRLVENLLDLSRLQAGAAEPRRDPVSLEEVVRAAVDTLMDRDAAAAFEVAIDPELPFVQADAAQLERVFVNLLENARRYSGAHPVKVRARAVGSRVRIRVIDRGPGIPARELPRIFEPFHQIPSRRPGGDHGGSGLGLAIVKGFVEANGGRVSVDSLPGQGTVFSIEFPVLDQPDRSDREPTPAGAA